jgi:hypothetical protein
MQAQLGIPNLSKVPQQCAQNAKLRDAARDLDQTLPQLLPRP